MRKLIYGAMVAMALLLPGAAIAQQGPAQRIGDWTLVSLGHTCVLSIKVEDQGFALTGQGAISLNSLDIDGLMLGSKPPIVLGLGTAKVALSGTVLTVASRNGIILSGNLATLLPQLRRSLRVTAANEGWPVFDIQLPANSSAAYDAFAKCNAAVPAKAQ